MAPTSKPWKEDIPVQGLAMACTINTFFALSALFDLSAVLYASPGQPDVQRFTFLAQWYTWRRAAPIIGKIELVLVLPLPFILFDFTRNALAALFDWRQATRTRQACDVLQWATLCGGIFPLLGFGLLPAQTEVIAACGALTAKSATAKCTAAVAQLLPLQCAMVGLNVLMFMADAYKYKGNRGTAPDASAKKLH